MFFFFLKNDTAPPTNRVAQDDPFEGCSCKEYADEIKRDIKELKEFLLHILETRPELGKKLVEIVFFKVDEEIVRPIEELTRDCDDLGYQDALPDEEIGCEAPNHRCICDD